MALSSTEIKEIAYLARIAIQDNEVPHFQKELSSILDFVAQLQSIDTDKVEPLANPLDQTQRLRADEVTETNQRDANQEGAPLVEEGLYLVPKVIE